MSTGKGPATATKPGAAAPASTPEHRLPVLAWLAWRFLPPLYRDDLRTLLRVGGACAYLAMPLTVALAALGARELPGVTAVSLLCLSVPGLPPLWRNAIRLGDRRRGTALALRQVRVGRRTAALTSLSRQVAYPLAGSLVGVALILLLHGLLGSILPGTAPLAVAIKDSAGSWTFAAILTPIVLMALTGLLSGEWARATGYWLGRTLSRVGRRAVRPQPQ
ncbi:hypothetical protein KDL01_10635 [Actinospica durhamensis]|uniref:Sensor domain-containing protein n=1 Tax=Actinospica durhamensis TaxID=1508375 RepID=A0A941EMN5_9ACTN|nr:hypothetical protein [Actinospica durhamensis]MBR7833723.1 hypothetical protein [Actinospica durhamensis]